MRWESALAAICAALSLVGCALSPTTEQAGKFGKSALAVSQAYLDARQLEIDLIVAGGVERNACTYLKNGTIGFPTPAEPSTDFEQKTKFIGAIVAYSKALSEATNPEKVAALEKSGAGLASAGAALANQAVVASTPAPAPSSLPVVGPSLQLASYIGVNLVELELRGRIRRIVEETENPLTAGVIKLVTDLDADKNRLRGSYNDWLEQKKCNLRRIRAGGISTADQYEAYLAADKLAKDYWLRRQVLEHTGQLLGSLLETHRALLSTDTDIVLALKEFEELAARLDAVKTALK